MYQQEMKLVSQSKIRKVVNQQKIQKLIFVDFRMS